MSVLDYHERSKHRLDRYAPGPGGLDWANQPDPFRRYPGAPRLALPLNAATLAASFADVRCGRLSTPARFDLDHIGALYELSLALSAWKEYGASRWALRCNPSSGNLHPTEAYLIAPRLPGLDAGVWHYVSADHALEHRAGITGPHWDRPFGAAGVWIALTSIYWREAWKYGMRAFRYCQHDCGHAIAALGYAAAVLGWEARVRFAAADAEIAALTGVDRAEAFIDAEPEAPEMLLWVGPPGSPLPDHRPLIPLLSGARWAGRANRLSAGVIAWPDIEAVHRGTIKPVTAEADGALPGRTAPAACLSGAAAQAIIRGRRSAVDFDGTTHIARTVFDGMLDALLPRPAPPWTAWRRPPRVHLFLFVHRVDGLEPGLYCLLRDEAAYRSLRAALRPEWLWARVGAGPLPLYMLLSHDLRETARLVCCHQDIAGDSCFSLGMLTSLSGVAEEPWQYRASYWECGMVGQVLYLEAEAAGLRGTGIGCFFDDEMHRLLGCRDHAWQSLYHFTVGGAVEDPRLASYPPYPTAN